MMRDYAEVEDESDDHPVPKLDDSEDWDGWGERPNDEPEIQAAVLAAQRGGEVARAGGASKPADLDGEWDGWGEPLHTEPAIKSLGAADAAESTTEPVTNEHERRPEIETAPELVSEGKTVEVDQVPPETLSTAEVTITEDDSDRLDAARSAVVDAYQDSPLPPSTSDTGSEQSEMRRCIGHSDARELHSLDEAEQYARENLGIERAELGEFDQPTANEMLATIEVFQDWCPEVTGVNYVGTIQERAEHLKAEQPELVATEPSLGKSPQDNVVASTLRDSEDLSGIAVNEAWAKGYASNTAELRTAAAAGASANGVDSISGVIAHEYGHVVHNYLHRHGMDRELNGMLGELSDEGASWIRQNVSNYANSSPAELFAELFAEYHMAAKPRPPSEAVGHYVDALLRKA